MTNSIMKVADILKGSDVRGFTSSVDLLKGIDLKGIASAVDLLKGSDVRGIAMAAEALRSIDITGIEKTFALVSMKSVLDSAAVGARIVGSSGLATRDPKK